MGQGYDLPHFVIDWEGQQVTCPQGKLSVTWRPARGDDGSPRINAQFSRTDCGACAVRTLCTPAKDARRSIYFHPREEYEALNAARARMRDAAWKARYHVRAGEGTLSQGVRALGLRQSGVGARIERRLCLPFSILRVSGSGRRPACRGLPSD
jgi:transposase